MLWREAQQTRLQDSGNVVRSRVEGEQTLRLKDRRPLSDRADPEDTGVHGVAGPVFTGVWRAPVAKFEAAARD